MGRILVIDEAKTVERLRPQLSALGHTVLIAADAYSGLSVATRERPDLIMIGLSLPGGGGVEMLKRLRGNTMTLSTPVIILFDGTEDAYAAPKDSQVRLLKKPTDSDTLSLLFRELLPRQPAPKAVEPESRLPPMGPPQNTGRSLPMDMGAPSDDDLPPGETIEL